MNTNSIAFRQARIFTTSVTPNGLYGPQWAERLSRRYDLSRIARDVLLSPGSGSITHLESERGLIILGTDLFGEKERVLGNIQNMANNMGCYRPRRDIACLLREAVSDSDLERMGFERLVIVHQEPQMPNGDRWYRLAVSKGGVLEAVQMGPCDHVALNVGLVFTYQV